MPYLPPKNYLSDEAILMQLILSEYISICRIMKPTLRLLKKELKKEWHQQNIVPILETIKHSVLEIGGPLKRPFFTTPWNRQQGKLEKLEDYSYLLVLNIERSNPTYYTLYQDVLSARVTIKNFLRLLQLWNRQSTIFLDSIEPAQVQLSLSALYDQIKKIAQSLSTVLQFSGKDENVALFLLRHQKEISSHIGRSFFRETIDRLYPFGASKAESDLKRKLKARGFDHLVAELPTLMKQAAVK